MANWTQIGLKERIKAATSLPAVKSLLAEGLLKKHASAVTIRKWAKEAAKKEKELA